MPRRRISTMLYERVGTFFLSCQNIFLTLNHQFLKSKALTLPPSTTHGYTNFLKSSSFHAVWKKSKQSFHTMNCMMNSKIACTTCQHNTEQTFFEPLLEISWQQLEKIDFAVLKSSVPKKYSHCWQNRIVLYSIFGRAWNPLIFQILSFSSILFCLLSFINAHNIFLIINYKQFLLLLLVILLSFMDVTFIFITHKIAHLLNQMLKHSFNTLPPNRHP